MKRLTLVLSALPLLLACGDDVSTGNDAGSTSDSGRRLDAFTSVPDSGVPFPDTGPRDVSGPTDSGTTVDSGTPDSGAPDTGMTVDAGMSPDSGGGDSGVSDAGAGASAVLYFWGDFVTDTVDQVAAIYPPNYTPTVLTLQGFETGDEIMGVAVGPNQIAVAGRNMASDNAVINLYAPDGSGAPTTLVTAPDSGRRFGALEFSPDGQWIAFTADLDVAGSTMLYVVPVSGGAAAKAVSPATADSSNDVQSFKWSPDVSGQGRYLAFVGDVVTDQVEGLWTVDVTPATPSAVEIVTQAELGGTGDVQRTLLFDSMNRLYFKSNFEVTEVFRLYRADIDGNNREQVPGTALNNGIESSVGAFGISENGMMLAFSADSPTAGLYQVFTMPLNSNTPALVSTVTSTASFPTSGPSFFDAMKFSPDGSLVAFAADWPVNPGDADNDFALFVVPSTPPSGGVRLFSVPANTNQDVETFEFAADSSRLFVLGDLVVNNDSEIYMTTDFSGADQDATNALIQDVPMGGDVYDIVRP